MLRGNREVTAKGYGISLEHDENVLKLIVVMAAQLCGHKKDTIDE